MNTDNLHHIIIVTGPTGVGKTGLVDELAKNAPIEIINADVGQLYVPMTIGTAKPDWKNAAVPHHMFDLCDTPANYSAHAYRSRAQEIVRDIWSRGNIPVFVGGSLFYIQSLLYELPEYALTSQDTPSVYSWDALHAVDPVRANQIHPHDRYRIQRALEIWYATGILPSKYKTVYNPISSYTLLYLHREREQLYQRINERVHTMLQSGWRTEAVGLSAPWKSFVREKGLLGYAELMMMPDENVDPAVIGAIQQKTRNYAKRQHTYWKMLKQKVAKEQSPSVSFCEEINLTFDEHALYLKQLFANIDRSWMRNV